MDKFDLLGMINISPDKSKIVRKGNMISIKHVNKKGDVKKREQCDSCSHLDKYQAGLGYAFMPCCSREDGWRAMWGETTRKCKFYDKK